MPAHLVEAFAVFASWIGLATITPDQADITKTIAGPVVEQRTMVTRARHKAPARVLPRRQVTLKIYLTGYSFWDNTPPGSAAIARPVVHRQAGGVGTYADPVTVAVGHRKLGGRSIMDFPAGTRFYFPKLQKYGIVEDLCGDGDAPQNGPCHTGYQGLPWLDIYVGGQSMTSARADRCMRAITGVQQVIVNPAPNLQVLPGEISTSTCR